MIKRATMKRERDKDLNSSGDDHRRRISILRAIENHPLKLSSQPSKSIFLRYNYKKIQYCPFLRCCCLDGDDGSSDRVDKTPNKETLDIGLSTVTPLPTDGLYHAVLVNLHDTSTLLGGNSMDAKHQPANKLSTSEESKESPTFATDKSNDIEGQKEHLTGK